jgi:hypothetical protein
MLKNAFFEKLTFLPLLLSLSFDAVSNITSFGAFSAISKISSSLISFNSLIL